MTTKEIAEAVGKDERTVRRWIKAVADKMSVVKDKMSASSPVNPADYDLDETVAIIEYGMGKNAASLYRMNASQSSQNDEVPAIQNADARIDRLEAMVEKLCATMMSQIAQPTQKAIPALKMKPRAELNMIVRQAGKSEDAFREAWGELYKHAYYRLGVNFTLRAKARDMATLDYVEQEGFIVDLLAIARDIFG